MMNEDDRAAMVDDIESSETQRAGINLSALFPGGISPGPQELAVGGIILGALLFAILVRRGFRPVLSK